MAANMAASKAASKATIGRALVLASLGIACP